MFKFYNSNCNNIIKAIYTNNEQYVLSARILNVNDYNEYVQRCYICIDKYFKHISLLIRYKQIKTKCIINYMYTNKNTFKSEFMIIVL